MSEPPVLPVVLILPPDSLFTHIRRSHRRFFCVSAAAVGQKFGFFPSGCHIPLAAGKKGVIL